eukprot:gene25375-biopygen15023
MPNPPHGHFPAGAGWHRAAPRFPGALVRGCPAAPATLQRFLGPLPWDDEALTSWGKRSAGRTIKSKETDADRTRAWPFLPERCCKNTAT